MSKLRQRWEAANKLDINSTKLKTKTNSYLIDFDKS